MRDVLRESPVLVELRGPQPVSCTDSQVLYHSRVFGQLCLQLFKTDCTFRARDKNSEICMVGQVSAGMDTTESYVELQPPI